MMNAKVRVTLGLTTALLLGAALGFSIQAQQAERKGGPGHGKASLDSFSASGLNLTAAQQAAAQKLHAEATAKAEPLISHYHLARVEIQQALDSANPNAADLGQKMIAAHADEKQLLALHEDIATRFSAQLNADQRTKFKEMKDKYLRHQYVPTSR